MDVSEKFKKGLTTFGSKLGAAADKLATETQKAAEKAQKFGNQAQAEFSLAAKNAQQGFQQRLNAGTGGAALVGTEVTINNKTVIIDSLLAEGGFGSVYTAINAPITNPTSTTPSSSTAATSSSSSSNSNNSNEKMVLKRMFAGNPDLARQLVSEVKLMDRLVHPNIVKVLGNSVQRIQTGSSDTTGVEIFVLMELCPGGHLLNRLNILKEQKKVLPWTKILEVFIQIVKPIAYMHNLDPSVTHRDLKFENILVAADGSLRLCDFGSTSTHQGQIKDKIDRAEQEDAILRYTTPHFRAPEMCDLFTSSPLDCRTDIWALGCMLYGLAYLSHPFQDSGNLAIMSARYKLPTHPPYPAPIHTTIRACLQYSPFDRPSAAQLVTYIEQCLKINNDHGPFPDLELSGGGSVKSVAVPSPQPGSEGALPDGSVMVTGMNTHNHQNNNNNSSNDPSSHVMRKAENKYAPTAQDILLQVQTQTLANAVTNTNKSSALQARLQKKGGVASVPVTNNLPVSQSTIVSTGNSSTPAVSSIPTQDLSSFSDDFASFSTSSTNVHQTSIPSTTSAATLADDTWDAFGGKGATSNDFSFDFEPSSSSSSSSVSHNNNDNNRARAPSGDATNSSSENNGIGDLLGESVSSSSSGSNHQRTSSSSVSSSSQHQPPTADGGGDAFSEMDFFNSPAPAPPQTTNNHHTTATVATMRTTSGLEDPFAAFNISSSSSSTVSAATSNSNKIMSQSKPFDDFFGM